MDTDSEIGETFKLTETRVNPRKSLISAFSDDLLNCQLCHSRFKNPKSLPCLHSFCETCLEVYIAKLPSVKSFFPCPVCKELNPTPRQTPACEWEIGNSKSTMSLNPTSSRSSLMDESMERPGRMSMALQLKTTERRCDPCAESEDNCLALYWCPTCREALCDMCTKSHRGMRITKSHALMDIEDVRERPIRMVQSHEVCTEHRGKLLDMYCQDHQTPVCSTCIAFHHRRCDTVMASDKKIIRTSRVRKSNKSLIQRMRQSINIVESVLGTKEGCKRRLIDRKDLILDEVSKTKLTVIQLLDELEERMKDEIDSVTRDYEDILQGKIERSRGLRDTIQSSLALLENNIEGNELNQMVSTQAMRNEVEKYENLADDERLDFKEVDLVFTPDENLSSMAKLVDRLGYVEISEKKEISKPFRHCSAQKSGILNGKIKGDRNGPIFNSVDISESGDIVLSDFNNCSIKLFDQFGMFRSFYKLNSPPRGVTMLPDKQIAVALPEECVIKMMSLEGKFLSQLKDIHTSFKAYRICNYRSKLMGICYAKSCRSLSIVEKNGRVEKTISRKRDYKGLGGVAFDPVKNYMYMSDRDSITCFNGHGHQVFQKTYKQRDLRGMALDCQGNLYACSHESGQVLQIASDGALIKSILVPLSPQDVAIEPMGNKMIVCGLGEIVHIYNLV